jgi:hypothetical protein
MDRIASRYLGPLRVTKRATRNPRCGVSHVSGEFNPEKDDLKLAVQREVASYPPTQNVKIVPIYQ